MPRRAHTFTETSLQIVGEVIVTATAYLAVAVANIWATVCFQIERRVAATTSSPSLVTYIRAGVAASGVQWNIYQLIVELVVIGEFGTDYIMQRHRSLARCGP